MKVAVCFFGLVRSLKYTHESIKKNLLNILEKNGIEYDIYMHTYDLKVLNNKRTHEKNVELDVNDYKLLNPKEIIIDNQDDFDNSFNYTKIMSYGNAWKTASFDDNFSSLRNLIRQLNSLKKVTSIIKKVNKYDKYIYIRPDLKILNEFNINWLKMNSNSIRTCMYFKHWGGLNDRFAIGDYENIVKYGDRLDCIYEFVNFKNNKRPLHAEQLVKFLFEKFKIKNIDIDFRLVRVRADGREQSCDIKTQTNM